MCSSSVRLCLGRHSAEHKGTRVVCLQLWVDGRFTAQVRSKAHSLNATWRWRPLNPGNNTLMVLAYTEQAGVGRDSVSVQTVRVGDRVPVTDDSDGDRVPKVNDLCPDEAGPPEENGCSPAALQDTNGDGLPDAADLCPEEAGVQENPGCPLVAREEEDPDGDGVPGAHDVYPDEPGPAGHGGCPEILSPADEDSDGIPDADDLCHQASVMENPASSGCPLASPEDADGDGIPDPEGEDRCPALQGAENGCPPWVVNLGGAMGIGEPYVCIVFPNVCEIASGGDKMQDRWDRCLGEAGPFLSEGCPWSLDPGEIPGRNPPICEAFPMSPVCRPFSPAKVEVVLGERLYTEDEWDRVWCYVEIEEARWLRLPFEGGSLGGGPRVWNTGEDRRLKVTARGRPELKLSIIRYGQQSPSDWPRPLGTIYRLHGPEDWTGSPFSAWSDGTPGRFEVIYWMCREECP
ncbi:MAG: hypothetical protein RMK30_08790 [Anaerolineae bacterium]|nr:hypothetical protein [Anaerolineae bacterium]